MPCALFLFKLRNGKNVSWSYKNHFYFDNKDIIHVLICKTCDNFYLGETQNFKQRIANHKADIKKPHANTFRICSENHRHRNQTERCFQIFPFFCKTNTALREYKEKRYVSMETSIKSKWNMKYIYSNVYW